MAGSVVLHALIGSRECLELTREMATRRRARLIIVRAAVKNVERRPRAAKTSSSAGSRRRPRERARVSTAASSATGERPPTGLGDAQHRRFERAPPRRPRARCSSSPSRRGQARPSARPFSARKQSGLHRLQGAARSPLDNSLAIATPIWEDNRNIHFLDV